MSAGEGRRANERGAAPEAVLGTRPGGRRGRRSHGLSACGGAEGSRGIAGRGWRDRRRNWPSTLSRGVVPAGAVRASAPLPAARAPQRLRSLGSRGRRPRRPLHARRPGRGPPGRAGPPGPLRPAVAAALYVLRGPVFRQCADPILRLPHGVHCPQRGPRLPARRHGPGARGPRRTVRPRLGPLRCRLGARRLRWLLGVGLATGLPSPQLPAPRLDQPPESCRRCRLGASAGQGWDPQDEAVSGLQGLPASPESSVPTERFPSGPRRVGRRD